MKWYTAAALIFLPCVAQAEFKGDLDAFDACIISVLAENTDNPFADMGAPIICGDAHIPAEQSCGWLAYKLPTQRGDCFQQDAAFWAHQLEKRIAEQGPPGSLYEQGIERCATAGDGRIACEAEVNWRTTMEYLSVLAQAK